MRNLDICMKCRCFDIYDDNKIVCRLDMLKERKTKGGLNVLEVKEANFGDRRKWGKYDVPPKCPFLTEQCIQSWN